MSGSARAFPEGFLFGAATSAHQVEGFNRHSDWWQAEEAGRLPFRSGAACRHFELYPHDFDLARTFGHNAHRLSVEWSRIEPAPGRFDEAALRHYHTVVQALRARGLEPVVTLQHFTLPHWAAADGGWLGGEQHIHRFLRYVERVVEALAPEVRLWLTVNEPTVYAKRAYVAGDWPPFRRRNWAAAARVVAAMMRAHRRAYTLIHRHRPDALVGFAHSAPYVMPRNPGSLRDRRAALGRDLLLNRLPLALAGRRFLDLLGINYYTRALVHGRARGLARLWGADWPGEDGEGPRRYSDLGWEIYPRGLGRLLRRFAALGVPLLVSENGLATRDEELRVRFLLDHLGEVAAALRAGVPVIGYLWWSLMDNYEWAEGFAPRFGLFAVDYATQARSPRPAAHVFARICRTRRLPDPAQGHGPGP